MKVGYSFLTSFSQYGPKNLGPGTRKKGKGKFPKNLLIRNRPSFGHFSGNKKTLDAPQKREYMCVHQCDECVSRTTPESNSE